MKAIVVTDIRVNLYDNDNKLIGYINKDIFVIDVNRELSYTFTTAIIKTLIAMYNESNAIDNVSKCIIINDNADRYLIEVNRDSNNDYKANLLIQNTGYLIFECEVNFMIDVINKLDAAYKDLHCS